MKKFILKSTAVALTTVCFDRKVICIVVARRTRSVWRSHYHWGCGVKMTMTGRDSDMANYWKDAPYLCISGLQRTPHGRPKPSKTKLFIWIGPAGKTDNPLKTNSFPEEKIPEFWWSAVRVEECRVLGGARRSRWRIADEQINVQGQSIHQTYPI